MSTSRNPLSHGQGIGLGRKMEGLGPLPSAGCRLDCFSTTGVEMGRILSPCIKWKGPGKEGMLGSGLSAQPRVCSLRLDSRGSQMSLHHQGAGRHKKKMAMWTWGQRAMATKMTMKRRKKRRPTWSLAAGTEVPTPAEGPPPALHGAFSITYLLSRG